MLQHGRAAHSFSKLMRSVGDSSCRDPSPTASQAAGGAANTAAGMPAAAGYGPSKVLWCCRGFTVQEFGRLHWSLLDHATDLSADGDRPADGRRLMIGRSHLGYVVWFSLFCAAAAMVCAPWPVGGVDARRTLRGQAGIHAGSITDGDVRPFFAPRIAAMISNSSLVQQPISAPEALIPDEGAAGNGLDPPSVSCV